MILDIQNFNRMMAGMNFTGKEMTKFLALYQAIKTIDNMSEQENEMNEDENGEENGDAMIVIPMVNEPMKKKKKAVSKTSYGSFRKLGTRK